MADQAVRVERSGPVTTVFLHRPARRNAVDGPTATAYPDTAAMTGLASRSRLTPIGASPSGAA